MSDSKATPAAVPSDAPSAGPASAPPVDALAVPAAAGEATTQSGAATPNGTTSAASGSAATTAAAAASRKRVFTFQKRWLHTLPIMEKTLPDSALDAASFAALKSANLVGDDGKPVDDANARDVIVCMLCDDPHSNRDVMKIWSRLNCRRGRIENHLMSKHPEFMLLLKQKREAEGDLAVQIFLQNMREGRCNVRSEISSGLYSNMQATLAPGTAHAHSELQLQAQKRTFGHDDFMMPAQATVNVTAGLPYRNMRDASDVSDVENRRKRAKSNGNGRDGVVATPMMLANAPVPPSPVEPVQRGPLAAFGELLHAALMSYVGPVGFAQWRGALADKMVVITGGERPSIARAASNLWLMGANVLVTFADQESTEAFAASYLAQLHNTEGVEPPRGVMLPLFCSLHTRPQIDEWTRSIASKFERVDFLINFVGEESDPKKNDAASLSDAAGANRERSKSNVDESISSSANRILEICQAFSSTCMQRGGRSAIVNITTQSDNVRTSMNCAAIEVMTKSLSNDLRASQVQVNCIVVEQSGNDTSEASAEQELELLHTILFLLSPASTRISGSVIHQRRQEATTRSAAGAEPTTTQSTTAEAIDVVQNQVI